MRSLAGWIKQWDGKKAAIIAAYCETPDESSDCCIRVWPKP